MASKINKVLCFRELPYTAKLVSIFESGKTKTKRVEGFYVETLLTDVELKRGSPYFTGKICARILQQSPALTVSTKFTVPIISTHFSTTNDSFWYCINSTLIINFWNLKDQYVKKGRILEMYCKCEWLSGYSWYLLMQSGLKVWCKSCFCKISAISWII